MSDDDLKAMRIRDRKEEDRQEKVGLPRYLAEVPAFRSFGPLRQITNLQGVEIPVSPNLLPFGPQRRKYRIAEADDDDDDDDDDDV